MNITFVPQSFFLLKNINCDHDIWNNIKVYVKVTIHYSQLTICNKNCDKQYSPKKIDKKERVSFDKNFQ